VTTQITNELSILWIPYFDEFLCTYERTKASKLLSSPLELKREQNTPQDANNFPSGLNLTADIDIE